MEQNKGNLNKPSTYRVEGLTSTNCALQFVNNVKQNDVKRVGSCILILILGLLSDTLFDQFSFIAITFYSIVILLGGYNLFYKGIIQLLKLKFGMNSLMTIAILGAAAIGEWREGAIVVILFVISEALERYAMNKARYSMQSLISLAPKEATIIRENEEIVIPVEQISINDIMLIKPGQKIAMDGVIVFGYSSINQATITGESIPVDKKVGDHVFAGTLNENGLLHIKITKLTQDTTLAKVIKLVEEAQAEKAPAQAFIDKFAAYYTPIIIGLAAMVAFLPPLLFSGNWHEWIYRGLSLLVIGCPSALVISTPLTIVTAIGHAAKHGVLIKGGLFLEEMASLQAIAFDKTGTLTTGTPYVTDIVSLGYMTEHKALKIAATIEKNAHHPFARAIVDKANQLDIYYGDLNIHNIHSFTGNGLQATIDNTTFYIGSPHWVEALYPHLFDAKLKVTLFGLQNAAKTVILLATADTLLLAIGIADEVRASVKPTILALHQLGIDDTILLTGDNHATAKAVAEQVGIRVFQSDLLPEHKQHYILSYQQKHQSIAMIGDRINDAASLASANVGIAMGGAGSDVVLETAQLVLMSDELSKLPFTVKLSRLAMLIIKQNIVVALSLKLIALVLLLAGALSMWGAIIADMGATLIVLINSLRLLKLN